MRRLKYFFTVAEGEKVTEKCFRRILLSSALGILLCMTCLISTTWALFTATLVSEGNSIEVGTFTASVTVSMGETAQISAESAYEYQLATPGTYTVTITNVGTAKGYCLVDLQKTTDEDAVEKFTTGTLYVDSNEQRVKSVSFAITVEGTEQYTLKVTPCWGADNTKLAQVNSQNFTVGTSVLTGVSEATTAEQETQENQEETSVGGDKTTAPAEEEKQEENKEQVSNETTTPTETQTQTQQSTDTTGGGSGDTPNTDATETDNGETTNGETSNEDVSSEPDSTQETTG